MGLPTIKLKTNIPTVGTIQSVGYWLGKEFKNEKTGEPEKGSDQISLNGVWDGQAGRIWLNASKALELIAIGAIQQLREPDQRGNPAYKVLTPARVLQILKTEEGTRKPITFLWVDGGPTTPAPPPPPANGQPAPAPHVKQPLPEDEAKAKAELSKLHHRARVRVVQVRDTMDAALETAKQVWDRKLAAWKIPPEKMPFELYITMIQKVGVSLAIQMLRENLVIEKKPEPPAAAPAPAPPAAAPPKGGAPKPPPQDHFPDDLEDGPDDELPF